MKPIRITLTAGLALTALVLRPSHPALAQCPPDTLLGTLDNPAPTADYQFGWSVAVSGNAAVVGAYRDDPGGVTDAGTAYVFDATTGALTATLNNPAPTENDLFGHSVAVSGDVAVVGAHWDNPGGVDRAGTAYVFTCADLVPTPTARAASSTRTTSSPSRPPSARTAGNPASPRRQPPCSGHQAASA